MTRKKWMKEEKVKKNAFTVLDNNSNRKSNFYGEDKDFRQVELFAYFIIQ